MRILVLSVERSASTWYCKQLASHYNLPNHDECFHAIMKESHGIILKRLLSKKSWVAKVFPVHISNSNLDNLEQILMSQADKIIYLIRQDINAQVQSLYIARQLGHYHKEFNEPMHMDLDFNVYMSTAQGIQDDIKTLSKWYHNDLNQSEVVFTEDVTNSQPYHRPVILNPAPPRIDFDSGKFFLTRYK